MSLLDTKVFEWMTAPIISVEPRMTISAAHQIMKENDIRRLPVLKNNKLVGLVTIGDVREASPSDATTLSIWEINYLWAQLTVDRIMTRDVVTIKQDAPVIEAAKLMLENKISGLPVVNEKGELVGMITESDIFRMIVHAEVEDLTKPV